MNSENTRKRVVVTGIGLVSPLGNTTEETWAGLIAGRSGVDYITRFDTSQHTVKFAAETKNFDPGKFIEKKELKKMDYFIYFAVAASKEAVNDSGLKIDDALFVAKVNQSKALLDQAKAQSEQADAKIDDAKANVTVCEANLQVAQAVTVVSVTIARDGRLLNVVVLSSSGFPELDRGVLAGVRSGSPYTPLPESIQGASATFRLPLVSSRAR